MGILTASDYVKFFLNLQMGDKVSLLSFINNEKRILKGKLETKNLKRERMLEGIEILDNLTKEISQIGEREVLQRYGK